jgi:hypothetical protein
MAVSFTAGTCWSPQEWALYAYDAGAWSRVRMVNSWLSQPLVAIGSGIHEVVPVFNTWDPRCLPSGGERRRTWQWNGDRLAAGHWHPVETPVARPGRQHRRRSPAAATQRPGRANPPWGQAITTARVRCTNTHRGMRCIVRKTGAGYVFGTRGAHRIAR